MAYYGLLRYIAAYYGILRLITVYYGLLRYITAYYELLRQFVSKKISLAICFQKKSLVFDFFI